MGIILNKECERIAAINSIATLVKIFLVQMLFNRFTEHIKFTTRVKSLQIEEISNGCNFEINFFRYGVNNDTTYLNGSITIV